MFATVYVSVLPTVASKHPNAKFIFRNQIQPWHPSSTLTHEAGVAVLRLYPEKFWQFSAKLFERQKEFFDVSVVKEARNETYERLVDIAGEVVTYPEAKSRLMDYLRIGDKPGPDGGLNSGNKVTDDIKFMVKAARMAGVHVTPTVVFDGVAENGISSGMNADEWEEWLKKNVD